MRGKYWFLGGVAVGFVLGARAGRERYDQLIGAARQLLDHPTVQETAGVVQEQANRAYTMGKDFVGDKLGSTRLGERFGRRADATPEPDLDPERDLTPSGGPAATGGATTGSSTAGGARPADNGTPTTPATGSAGPAVQ